MSPAAEPGAGAADLVAPANRVYPLGYLGLGLVNATFTQWVVFFHAPPPAGGPADRTAGALGAALLVGFCVMGLANPWIGYWSDRVRHPWGRRRPFVLLGALPLAAVFALLWRPWPTPVAAALVVAQCALFALVCQPYFSLLPSLAASAAARTRLSLTGAVLGLLAMGLALVGAPWLIERAGFAALGWVGGAALLLTVLLPTLLLREAPPGEVAPSAGGAAAYAREILSLAARPDLRGLLLANGAAVLGLLSLTIALPYLVVALLEAPRTYTGALNAFFVGGTLLAIPVVARIPAARQHRLLALGAGGCALVLLGLAASSAAGVPQAALAGALPAWWLGMLLVGFTYLAGVAVVPVVLSRLADRDGRAREGLFFGLNAMAMNLGNAAGALATGLLLEQGRSREEPGGVRATLVLGGLLLAAASVLFWRHGEVHLNEGLSEGLSEGLREAA